MSKEDPLVPIAIDHGFDGIKTPHFSFTTGIAEIDEPITQENILWHNGKHYRIGIHRIDVLEDKTTTEAFRLLSYAAIAMELDRLGLKKARVVLAVGLPIGRLAREKESFRQYLMDLLDVKCRFSGKAYIFTIENVIVYKRVAIFFFL